MKTIRDDAGHPIAWLEYETAKRGLNEHCLAAIRLGLRWHVIPHFQDPRAEQFTLAMPTYHFGTEEDALAGLAAAWDSAEVAYTVEQRDSAYARGVPVMIAKGVRAP